MLGIRWEILFYMEAGQQRFSLWAGIKAVSEEGVKWDALADASCLLSQILQQDLAHLHWRLVFWACK